MELGTLTETIDDLSKSLASNGADGETIVALERQLARLECLVTKAVADFDTSGAWALDGSRNPSVWIATRCRLAKGHARCPLP